MWDLPTLCDALIIFSHGVTVPDISELTDAYIGMRFPPILQSQISQALTLLDRLGVKYYEDDLEAIIAMEGLIEPDDIQSLFLNKITRYLNEVLKEHHITLSTEQDILFGERLEVCQFLLLVQSLEDRTFLGYLVFSDDTPRRKLCGLLARYSYLTEVRAMEIIGDVQDDLIAAMKKLCEEDSYQVVYIQKKQRLEWRAFTEFIGENVTTIAHILNEQGFNHIPLRHLLDLALPTIAERLNTFKDSRAQQALDIISLLLFCQDTYQIPLMEYDKYATELLSSMDDVSATRDIIVKMLKDFSVYREAFFEKLKLAKGETRG